MINAYKRFVVRHQICSITPAIGESTTNQISPIMYDKEKLDHQQWWSFFVVHSKIKKEDGLATIATGLPYKVNTQLTRKLAYYDGVVILIEQNAWSPIDGDFTLSPIFQLTRKLAYYGGVVILR